MNAAPDDTTAQGLDETTQRVALRVFAVGTMTFFLAVASQIAIPTAPLGIPISLQTLAVVLTALTLGPRFGLLSVLLYVGIGAFGAGVFAEGESGWLTIVGQTGGYILGFIVCQPIVGWIVRRRDKSVRGFGAILVAAVAAHAVVFCFGVPWLYWVRVLDAQADVLRWGDALYYGMVVFLPGMVLKSALAAVIGMWMVPACAKRIW